LRTSLALIADVRPAVSAPIVVFSYANPLLRMGLKAFAQQAADAGVDGVLALDLPIEEAGSFRETLAASQIDTIFLLSPTTTDARIRKAAELGSGFLYGGTRWRRALMRSSGGSGRTHPCRSRSDSASRARSTSRKWGRMRTPRSSGARWFRSSRKRTARRM